MQAGARDGVDPDESAYYTPQLHSASVRVVRDFTADYIDAGASIERPTASATSMPSTPADMMPPA